MSAFICGPDHFKALAIFAASRGSFGHNVDPRYIDGLRDSGSERLTDLQLANLYADILYLENVRSVHHRYGGARDDLPGPCADAGHVTITCRDQCKPAYMLQCVKAVGILKMCDCLEYQSCENEDYRTTLAYRVLDAIRNAAIRHVPGYDDAPWDYADKAKAAA